MPSSRVFFLLALTTVLVVVGVVVPDLGKLALVLDGAILAAFVVDYPQVRWDGKVGHLLVLAHRRSLGRHPQRIRGLGREPYALREYLPGDPPNKIHWKATARHGRLITREET